MSTPADHLAFALVEIRGERQLRAVERQAARVQAELDRFAWEEYHNKTPEQRRTLWERAARR
jgi:hypothetical protein